MNAYRARRYRTTNSELLEMEPMESNEQEAGWIPELVKTLWKIESSFPQPTAQSIHQMTYPNFIILL
jgi:hypothetical protein